MKIGTGWIIARHVYKQRAGWKWEMAMKDVFDTKREASEVAAAIVSDYKTKKRAGLIKIIKATVEVTP